MEFGKIMIVDNESQITNRVELILMKLGHLQNRIVSDFNEAESLLRKEYFDLIICKVSSSISDTMSFLNRILANKNTPVVYIVEKENEDLYEKDNLPNLYSFLIHPFNTLTFRSVIEIYFKDLKEKRRKGTLLIHKGSNHAEASFDQILWIRSEGNYCNIGTNNKVYSLRTTIKSMMEKLPESSFVQVHRSSIINFRKIENVNFKDKNVVVKGKDIPIGRKYKKGLLEKLNII